MRLWHKDLIPYLPRKQLLGQWRECCCIAKNITVDGTPNHILVNKIMDYPIEHFIRYSAEVARCMTNYGYHINIDRFERYFEDIMDDIEILSLSDIFNGWHNDRYLRQCLYNLQEKYDCGGVSQQEFDRITERFVVCV